VRLWRIELGLGLHLLTAECLHVGLRGGVRRYMHERGEVSTMSLGYTSACNKPAIGLCLFGQWKKFQSPGNPCLVSGSFPCLMPRLKLTHQQHLPPAPLVAWAEAACSHPPLRPSPPPPLQAPAGREERPWPGWRLGHGGGWR
jgi:hypothetical protein